MIISASRRTDVPAFYGEWFIDRIKAGSVSVKNPFNSKIVRKVFLNPDAVDCIVFWTKNPGPFIDKLKLLGEYSYYFLFTLTPYDKALERNVPSKKELIGTFRKLSGMIGEERVIWRYDPIIYTGDINMDYHVKNFEFLAGKLHGYTTKCIISFLCMYTKCRKKLEGTGARELNEYEMHALSAKIADIARSYGISTEACAVKTDLSAFGIYPSSCIDKALIEKITGKKLETGRDKNQRKECNCYESFDIGQYNTCYHNCLYCYANKRDSAHNKRDSAHILRSAPVPLTI
jgi:DNA repair photolyase